MKSLLAIAIVLSAAPLAAFAGGVNGQIGNGGDMCEDRVRVISDDIRSWIIKGGGSALNLPADVSLNQYAAKMQSSMRDAVVSCSNSLIKINGVEKACENIRSSAGERLICNQQRFLSMSEADQYVLVHHEYAGLSGFETNDGPRSNYQVSNQISEYLVDQVVKRLAVKAPSPSVVASPGYFKSRIFAGSCKNLDKISIIGAESSSFRDLVMAKTASKGISVNSAHFNLGGARSSQNSAQNLIPVGTVFDIGVDFSLTTADGTELRVDVESYPYAMRIVNGDESNSYPKVMRFAFTDEQDAQKQDAEGNVLPATGLRCEVTSQIAYVALINQKFNTIASVLKYSDHEF